jgi:hypothetical protein
MAENGPLLGSAYLARPPPILPGVGHGLGPSTCLNLSAFKDVLRQSRAVDDTVLVRLNRAQALARDRSSSSSSSSDQQVCSTFFNQLVGTFSGVRISGLEPD